ncbi:SIS domain-containing protein [Parafilimonas sp.]|uniref:SIS domain-containing protein n=1 Tax=Parafilimonas sp. TaxID=1969739 RepID=UPI0039E50E25
MQLLGLQQSYLEKKSARLTACEIAGQPELWEATEQLFLEHNSGMQSFLNRAYKEADNIILTGAGTSAFIGLSLEGVFFRHTGIHTKAIATTNIVSHPQDYFNKDHTSFIISFARSGNSPESCAALELADRFSKKCIHLIITCDENGALAQYETANPKYVFVLPKAANDKSLAMTGSYSGMLLTGLMIAYINQPLTIKVQTQLVIKAARHILSGALTTLQETAAKDFKRAVFLGSGNLFGTATEASLKLQELTDGKIICKEDSYLGLRHGPKAVIDEQTLVVYFFSNNNYVKQYEYDLADAMKNGNHALYEIGISEKKEDAIALDAQINFGFDGEQIDEDFLPVCAIVAGQILAFYKSLNLGLTPDNPSINGAISRVVQGVTIYPVEEGKTAINNS